jgi:hypothetical protein
MNGAELVERHGMVLQSGRGPIPNLPELVVGGPVAGSWWGHPRHDEIFRALNEAVDSGQVARLRLVANKLTLVHRRLWPAVVCLAADFRPEQLARRDEEHTPSGRHRARNTPFPDWVPADVLQDGRRLASDAARAQLPACLR